MNKALLRENKSLPDFFKPLLWSYNFSKINSENHKEAIIANAINYGDLKHWRWINKAYGRNAIVGVLKNMPATGLRPRALRLASIIFSIKNFKYEPRGTKRER
ncbi:MAG: hypothetical protein V1705_00535 [bacterium]